MKTFFNSRITQLIFTKFCYLLCFGIFFETCCVYVKKDIEMTIVKIEEPEDLLNDYKSKYEDCLLNLERGCDVCLTINELQEKIEIARTLLLRERELENEERMELENAGIKIQEIKKARQEEDGIGIENEEKHLITTTITTTIIKKSEEMWKDSEMDKKHCEYVLRDILPKAIGSLLSLDLLRCDYNEIANYQQLMLSQQPQPIKPNIMEPTDLHEMSSEEIIDTDMMDSIQIANSSPAQLREVLVQQIVNFLQFSIEAIFQIGLDRFPKYCQATSGKWAANDDYFFDRIHHLYFQLINHFGDIDGFDQLLHFLRNEKCPATLMANDHASHVSSDHGTASTANAISSVKDDIPYERGNLTHDQLLNFFFALNDALQYCRMEIKNTFAPMAFEVCICVHIFLFCATHSNLTRSENKWQFF
ncbi:hypothetical protein RFI_17902 [Reticulomyxa filosa]|uniref:Uncharacterized protein n=1 Tax=Reticulomyxa filosa TaxID=46433 RepID=X6N0R3_RETFI|nr:hypothetical protein RFI_17902 [Reticulomyxa filosa]|eukprot:ETO19329.1 hypothetical protein RFI_17902 [Reticulomyxa filosa]